MKDSNIWQDRAKSNPFIVPQGYFESFEERMMARIAVETKPATKRFLPMPMIRWIAGVAAVFKSTLAPGITPLSMVTT